MATERPTNVSAARKRRQPFRPTTGLQRTTREAGWGLNNNSEADFPPRRGREPPASAPPAGSPCPRGSASSPLRCPFPPRSGAPSSSSPSPAREGTQNVRTQSGSASGASPSFFLSSRPRPPAHPVPPTPPAATTAAHGSAMRSQLPRHRSGSSWAPHQLPTL
uniref:Uncharacterized protein n=1 Tax=Myotis myotis TaxID=51298 RepID=A0A7J7RUR7_MYOMY|nr:hypothetical protein mMyoMyo1_010149 [Myotis myotis]